MSMQIPSMDQWLQDAKSEADAAQCGMYLFHNGIVRQTSKATVREGKEGDLPVAGMYFDYDEAMVESAIAAARKMPGIFYVRVWLNRGALCVGDSIMLVLVGGDIRPHVIDALQALVGTLKEQCVTEREAFSEPSA